MLHFGMCVCISNSFNGDVLEVMRELDKTSDEVCLVFFVPFCRSY